MIYYVNFEKESHLDSIYRVRMKNFDLSQIIKDKILSKEDDDSTNTIHLMIDEYGTQHLSITEASLLNRIFENLEQFQNSTIFIAAHPIKISSKKKKILEFKPMLKELKNFHFYNLKYVVRMTKEIHNLAKNTQKYLNNKSNQYI